MHLSFSLGRFQSTHPVRGGTAKTLDGDAIPRFQSTHPVRGGTNPVATVKRTTAFQSTHPVRGGTQHTSCQNSRGRDFNPPTPCGVGQHTSYQSEHLFRISIHPPRAGWDVPLVNPPEGINPISIHPPRAGWDRSKRDRAISARDFNPPTPCGVGLSGMAGQFRDL